MLQLRNRMMAGIITWEQFGGIMRDLNLIRKLNLTMKLI
jgi:hypothetical protein